MKVASLLFGAIGSLTLHSSVGKRDEFHDQLAEATSAVLEEVQRVRGFYSSISYSLSPSILLIDMS